MKQQHLNLKEMNKICLFGASGHGKVIKDIVLSTNNNVEAFFDDNRTNNQLLEIPVFSSDEIKKYEENKFIISIGDNAIRKVISNKLKVNFTKAIHKTAIVSDSVIIEEGTVVMAGAIVNADTKIGKHCIINTNAVIEHDCEIKDFVHISPSATVTGNVTIGEGTHIGAGATIIPGIKIGKWVIVGAGSVIINNIPDDAIVAGNPGRIIKYKEKENE